MPQSSDAQTALLLTRRPAIMFKASARHIGSVDNTTTIGKASNVRLDGMADQPAKDARSQNKTGTYDRHHLETFCG